MKFELENKSDIDVVERFRKGATTKFPIKEKKRVWQRIEQSIEHIEHQRVTRRYIIYRWMAAASIILAAGIGVLFNTSPFPLHNSTREKLVVSTSQQERKEVTLPDSSVVLLNASSRIEYPESFGNRRQVTLVGEAWFDVKHDDSRPFIVTTANANVSVLGTQFTMSDYPDASYADVVLIKGAVKVHDRAKNNVGCLRPNQQWSLNKTTKSTTIAEVDADACSSWVTGRMTFENATLDIICKRLEHWYGVKFVVADDVKSLHRLSFTVKNESLHETLNTIKLIAPSINFEEKSNTIIVKTQNVK